MIKKLRTSLLRHLRQTHKSDSIPSLISRRDIFEPMPSTVDVLKVVSDRKLFDETIYTSLEVAWEELATRRQDRNLEKKVTEFIGGDVPEPFLKEAQAVLFRNLATPNYEVGRFISLINGFGKLKPLVFEYVDDKFTSNNEAKRMLGKMYFAHSLGRKGGMNLDSRNIIEFVESDGRLISEIETLWGQSLVSFHHEYLEHCYPEMPLSLYDASFWLKTKGRKAAEYYKAFFALFIRHGILFENMMLDEKEYAFAKNVFVPSFLSVCENFGMKPLIVALEPTDIEGDMFWMCYPSTDMPYVQGKML